MVAQSGLMMLIMTRNRTKKKMVPQKIIIHCNCRLSYWPLIRGRVDLETTSEKLATSLVNDALNFKHEYYKYTDIFAKDSHIFQQKITVYLTAALS